MSVREEALPIFRDEADDRLLAHVAFEATFERDLESEAVRWHPRAQSVFGYQRSEVVGHVSWWRERVHPDDLPRVEREVAEVISGGGPAWSTEYRFRRRDGSWAWVCSRGAIERDSEGRAVRAVGAMLDITPFKETEARLRLFADQIPARATATDRDLRVVWDAGAGFSSTISVVGKTVAELFASSPDRERVLEACRKALAGESSKLLIDNGQEAAQLQIGPVRDLAGEVIGVMGAAVDITERVRAESALRETQRVLFAAQRVGQVRAWEEDLRTGMVRLDLVGATGVGQFEQRTKEEVWKRIHPGDFTRLMEMRRRTLEEGRPFETEYRMVRPDGAERNILVRGELIRDGAGRPERIIGVSLDVTDRVRGEEEIRSNQRLLQRVLDTLPVGVVVVDRKGDVLLTNPVSTRIWGAHVPVSGEERWATSKGYWHGTGQPIGPGEWASERALARGETSLDELIDIETYDGLRKTIENSASPIRDAQGTIVGAVIVNQEVTESRRAEEEVARRARQQAAVARLSLVALKGEGLEKLFAEAAALVTSTLDVEYGVVAEWLSEKQEIAIRATAGPWQQEIFQRYTVRTLPGLMAWFYMRSPVPVVFADLPHETRFAPCEILVEHGVKSGIAVPIAGKVRPFGVLEGNTARQRAFSEDEVNFLWSMANVLATYIEQRRVADELQDKRQELHALSGKLIDAQEAERRAVARELHDDFGQVLTAIRLNLMRHERDEAESIALVDGAIARMRDLAHDLRPPMLDELGLGASLRWYVEREARRAGLEFHFSIAPPELRPPPNVETTCFRVAQEAFTNVIRHAQARRVDVELRSAEGVLELVLRDDGRGFDLAVARQRAARGESQGLLSMQERVALAGGELAIDTAPGRGTTLRARFP